MHQEGRKCRTNNQKKKWNSVQGKVVIGEEYDKWPTQFWVWHLINHISIFFSLLKCHTYPKSHTHVPFEATGKCCSGKLYSKQKKLKQVFWHQKSHNTQGRLELCLAQRGTTGLTVSWSHWGEIDFEVWRIILSYKDIQSYPQYTLTGMSVHTVSNSAGPLELYKVLNLAYSCSLSLWRSDLG